MQNKDISKTQQQTFLQMEEYLKVLFLPSTIV